MEMLPVGVKIVVIPSPYEAWGNPLIQQLFCRTLEMRLAGYKSEYGAGVLPLDGADFIGVHYIVCRDGPEGLKPLMAFRSTTLSDSKRHGVSFGGLSLTRAANAPEHADSMLEILKHCEAKGHNIAYIASWTMDPALRKDPELRRLMRELFMAIAVLSHHETSTRIIGGCTMRFKVDQWFSKWGFEPVVGMRADTLPPMEIPFLLGEKVRLMYLKRFTPEILREAEKWRSAWDNRLILPEIKVASVAHIRKVA